MSDLLAVVIVQSIFVSSIHYSCCNGGLWCFHLHTSIHEKNARWCMHACDNEERGRMGGSFCKEKSASFFVTVVLEWLTPFRFPLVVVPFAAVKLLTLVVVMVVVVVAECWCVSIYQNAAGALLFCKSLGKKTSSITAWR